MTTKIDSTVPLAATGAEDDLRVVAKLCSAGQCPTIYQTPSGDLLVQGYVTHDAGVDLPEGEGLVRIPPALLAEALRSMA